MACAQGIYNHITDSAFIDVFMNLYFRFLDEGKYEDFKDYEKILKEEFEKLNVGKFIKANKRPFSFTFDYRNETIYRFGYKKGYVFLQTISTKS